MFRMPEVKFGSDILNEGVSKLMQRLMQKHLKEQELAETHGYHQSELGLRKQELSSLDAYRKLEGQKISSEIANTDYINNLMRVAAGLPPKNNSSGISRASSNNPINNQNGNINQASMQSGLNNQQPNQPITPQQARDILIRMKKIQETPEEESKRKVQESKDIKQNDINISKSSEIEKGFPHLSSSYNTSQLIKLLLKDSNVTGPVKGRLADWGLSNNKLPGTLQGLFGQLQQDVSKYATARPGVGSLKWAETIKPSIKKPENYNIGLAESAASNIANTYREEDKAYYAVTGKHLPKLQDLNPNDPIVKGAIKAIKSGIPLDAVMKRMNELRDKQNAA